MNSHYFTDNENIKTDPHRIIYYFGANRYVFNTDAGVFSPKKVDSATDFLLKNIPPISGSLLDMGCGYGCLGIVLAKEHGLKLSQADINPRAVRLTKENADINAVVSDVFLSDGFADINKTFDNIAVNPPIHAGKKVVYDMYEKSFLHLNPGGSLFVVIFKKHGAESSREKLTEIFGNADVLHKKKGMYLMEMKKSCAAVSGSEAVAED